MNKLQWRTEPATALATLLQQATLEQSAAIGTSTLYHVTHEGRQKIAISLPDGQALIIESGEAAIIRRRRIDPLKTEETED